MWEEIKPSHINAINGQTLYEVLESPKTFAFQFVPSALQLRFQAELNQMETIQEAERQLQHLDQIRLASLCPRS